MHVYKFQYYWLYYAVLLWMVISGDTCPCRKTRLNFKIDQIEQWKKDGFRPEFTIGDGWI